MVNMFFCAALSRNPVEAAMSATRPRPEILPVLLENGCSNFGDDRNKEKWYYNGDIPNICRTKIFQLVADFAPSYKVMEYFFLARWLMGTWTLSRTLSKRGRTLMHSVTLSVIGHLLIK